MSGTFEDDDQYVSTRDEPPPVRARKARPTVDDNPQAGVREVDEQVADRPAPDDAVAAMAKRAKDAENRAAELEAERNRLQKERDDLARGKTEAESRVGSAQKQTLLTEIEKEDQRAAAAKRARRQAREAGDFDAEEAADEELRAATTRKALLERDKVAWEDWEREQAEETARKAKEAPPKPAAAPAAKPGYSPADQEWIDKHPEFNDDPDCQGIVVATINKAVARGVRQGSPAYYDAADEGYRRYQRVKQAEQREANPEPEPEPEPAPRVRQEQPQPRRQQPSTASMAPSPSRTGGGDGGARERGVNRDAVLRRANITIEEAQDFARGRVGGLDGYIKSLANDLGIN